MKKNLYETPVCLSISLDTESNVMTGSPTGGDYGNTGFPGSDLDILPEIVF